MLLIVSKEINFLLARGLLSLRKSLRQMSETATFVRQLLSNTLPESIGTFGILSCRKFTTSLMMGNKSKKLTLKIRKATSQLWLHLKLCSKNGIVKMF